MQCRILLGRHSFKNNMPTRSWSYFWVRVKISLPLLNTAGNEIVQFELLKPKSTSKKRTTDERLNKVGGAIVFPWD